MKYSISHAETWDEYIDIWNSSMVRLPWFQNPGPADYNPDLERKELFEDFHDDDHVFLIARDEDGNGVGVLDFRCYQTHAKNGIMMPGVLDQLKYTNIGDALLQYQEYYLKNRGITTILTTIKYTSKEATSWYFDTLKRNGFSMSEPEGYQMVVDLKVLTSLRVSNHYEILDRNNFILEDFVEFAVRSYASTPEDREVHGWDKAVTDPEHIGAIHKRTAEGKLGNSPPSWWRVIAQDKKPLGYILGFEFNPEINPRTATIGNLGVFPEFRRKGLAVLLIHSLFNEFLKSGISIARVGTPTHNTNAIGAYSKAGFQEANRIQFFRKDIS